MTTVESIGEGLDEYIQKKVREYEVSGTVHYDDIYTDTFSELIDKLIVVHIRYWNFENDLALAQTDKEVAEIKRKSEILFKEKRPMLVKALDKLFYQRINGNVNYTPSNLKNYKGWNQKDKL